MVEPHIEKLPLELASQTGVELTGLDEGLEKADIVVLLVDHQAFRGIPQEAYAGKAVIDTRGIWGSDGHLSRLKRMNIVTPFIS